MDYKCKKCNSDLRQTQTDDGITLTCDICKISIKKPDYQFIDMDFEDDTDTMVILEN